MDIIGARFTQEKYKNTDRIEVIITIKNNYSEALVVELPGVNGQKDTLQPWSVFIVNRDGKIVSKQPEFLTCNTMGKNQTKGKMIGNGRFVNPGQTIDILLNLSFILPHILPSGKYDVFLTQRRVSQRILISFLID